MKITSENRESIVDAYVNRVLDEMDTNTLMQLAYDLLCKDKESYTNEELETEINEYYPDILE